MDGGNFFDAPRGVIWPLYDLDLNFTNPLAPHAHQDNLIPNFHDLKGQLHIIDP